jgi:hypothetical protein
MPFVFKRLALALSIAAALAANKQALAADTPSQFKPGEASIFQFKQTNAGVTVAVDAYVTPGKVKEAFGKLDPYEYGILPVLMVIQNDTDKTIKLTGLKAEYGAGRKRVVAIPAREVRYLKPPERPKMVAGPGDRVKVLKTKKNPLDAWEIEGRSFAAQMLPPGNSAYGFFYFQTELQPGASFQLSGLTEAASGKELFFFDVPMQ